MKLNGTCRLFTLVLLFVSSVSQSQTPPEGFKEGLLVELYTSELLSDSRTSSTMRDSQHSLSLSGFEKTMPVAEPMAVPPFTAGTLRFGSELASADNQSRTDAMSTVTGMKWQGAVETSQSGRYNYAVSAEGIPENTKCMTMLIVNDTQKGPVLFSSNERAQLVLDVRARKGITPISLSIKCDSPFLSSNIELVFERKAEEERDFQKMDREAFFHRVR